MPDGASEDLTIETGNWLTFYQMLAEALRSGSPLPVLPDQAVITARLIDLARESATTR